jgi:hypothetical protein
MCFSFLKTLFLLLKTFIFGAMAQNKGGRPRLPETEKKVHKVVIRMTKGEWSSFTKTYKAGLYPSYTAFILDRTSSLSSKLTPEELNQIWELRIAVDGLIEQYKKIGTNFNQLMHLAQAEKRTPGVNSLNNVAEQFKQLTQSSSKYLGLINKMKEKWL